MCIYNIYNIIILLLCSKFCMECKGEVDEQYSETIIISFLLCMQLYWGYNNYCNKISADVHKFSIMYTSHSIDLYYHNAYRNRSLRLFNTMISMHVIQKNNINYTNQ